MATITSDINLSAVSYTAGEAIDIRNGAVLTVDSTPATRPGTISCTTSGKLRIANTSTTDPIVLTLNTNTNDLRFEKNGILEGRGDKIQLGTGNGTSGQSFSLASSPLDIIPYPSYVEVETANGSGIYRPWRVVPTAGYSVLWTASEFSTLQSGNVFFWDGTTRTLSVGDGTNGNVISSGRKVRINNIYIHSNVTASTPNTRSLVDLNPSGTADLECASFSNAIYWANTAFAKVRCVSVGFAGHFTNTTSNGTLELRNVSVNPDTEQTTVSQAFQANIILGNCIIDGVTTLTGGLVTGGNKNVISQLFSLTSDAGTPKITNCSFARRAGRSSAGDESLSSANLPPDTFFENVACIGGRIELSNMSDVTFIDLAHADDLGNAQITNLSGNALILTNVSNLRFVNFGNAGVATCRAEICSPDSQSSNVSFFNGTYNGGGNTSGLGAGNGSGLSFYNFTLENHRGGQPIWNSPSTFLSSAANILNCRVTSTGSLVSEACQMAIFDLMPCNPSQLSTVFSGASFYAFANCIDAGLTPTTGSIVFGPFGNYDAMTFTGQAQLDQAGGVELFNSGDIIEVESLFIMHGVTSFQNASPTYTYTESATLNTDTTTAPSGLTFEFRVRTPSGTYGAYQTLNGTNLSGALAALSGYDSDVGFYIQMRVTATSTDITRVLNQCYFLTNVDNTYVAPDSTITIIGANPTDNVRIYRNEGGGPSSDTLLYEFVGSGTFAFSSAANFLDEIYTVRYSAADEIIMSTRSTPSILLLGDNGTRALFSGEEVQLAQSTDVSLIKAAVDTYLDAAISSRLAAASYTAPDNASITAILADTNELQTNQGNWLTATGFSTHSAADAADAVWNEAYADHTTAGTFGKLMDIMRKANRAIEGQTAGIPTTTVIPTDLTGYPDGAFDHELLVLNGLGIARPILSYSATNGTITLQEPLPSAPASGLDIIILPQHIHPTSEIASAVEAALIDEDDGQQILQAILDKIDGQLDLSGTGVSAIALGVRSELATELGRIDAAVSSRLATASYTAPDNAGITANGVAIAALNDVSSADVQTAAAAALTAYDAPTKAELDTAIGTVNSAIAALNDIAASDVVTAMQAVADDFKADVSSLATSTELNTVNEGVKKASLFIPHTTDI